MSSGRRILLSGELKIRIELAPSDDSRIAERLRSLQFWNETQQ